MANICIEFIRTQFQIRQCQVLKYDAFGLASSYPVSTNLDFQVVCYETIRFDCQAHISGVGYIVTFNMYESALFDLTRVLEPLNHDSFLLGVREVTVHYR